MQLRLDLLRALTVAFGMLIAACGDNQQTCDNGSCASSCGNGTQETGEACDTAIPAGEPGACPVAAEDCDDGIACTLDAVGGEGCLAMCTYTPISEIGGDDGCCPSGGTADTDIDCSRQCGNGTVDPGETCDTAIAAGVGRCATAVDCDDANACTDDSVLSKGTCQAVCLNPPTTMLQNGDACCPVNGNANVDSDCAPVCGNGTLETGEACDTSIPAGLAGACPSSCDDGVACTNDFTTGAGCSLRCEHQAITAPGAVDSCCPVGGDATNDMDCAPKCGNGVFEPNGGEKCDIAVTSGAGKCPGSSADCADGNACTTDTSSGVGCNAACQYAAVTSCASGDGCCPGGCTANNDSDCAPLCGNAALEPGESCDTAITSGNGTCPMAGGCSDNNSCTRDQPSGSGCETQCAHQKITTPTDGDGCCAADYNTDSDCQSSCGNGVLEPTAGELCDPNATGAADCPTSCADANACTTDTMSGTGCATSCSNTAVSACVGGDGCCPAGCNKLTDSDCSTLCGNGILESDETCDTGIATGAGSCPTACDDSNPNTRDEVESAGTCRARCVHSPITACKGGDNACPAGCSANTDPDCAATCGNAIVEGAEQCDSGITSGPGACPTSCSDGAVCTTDTLVGSGCARSCSYSEITACVSGDGCCAAGCDQLSDSDCSGQCGNGSVETGETCDSGITSGPNACPVSCDDSNPATADSLENPGTCTARCVHTPITACTPGDGFCAAGCNANTDNDCVVACGNGAVEAGESCDTGIPGSCPTTCGNAPVCQSVTLVGAGTCTARCQYTDMPAPCCGNSVVETGERCDTGLAPGSPGACPSSCNDSDSCTVDTLYGSGCQLACANVFDVPDCPAPIGSNNYTQCGRIYDLATSTPLDDGRPETGTPYREVEIRVYDPIQFAANPNNAPVIDTVYPNSCGWFEAFNLPRPISGFSAPGVDDCEDPVASGDPATACDEPAVDRYVPTGASSVVEPGEIERNMNIFFTTHQTDANWTQQAGVTGATLGERGIYFPIVIDSSREGRLKEWAGPFEGTTVPNVRVTISQNAGPYQDYYFSDTKPLSRLVLDLAATVTGINGSGIFTTLTTTVFNAGGSGNERTNPSRPQGSQMCSWTSHPAAAVPGIIFVQERWPVCCTQDSDCYSGEICSASNCYTSCTNNGQPDQSVCDALEVQLYGGRPDRQLKCLDETKPVGRFACRRP